MSLPSDLLTLNFVDCVELDEVFDAVLFNEGVRYFHNNTSNEIG
jgi:hypothetical protein